MGIDEGTEFFGADPPCRVWPLMVGGIGNDGSLDPYDSPFAMVITIEVNAVPGLREVFTRQRNGEEFDVKSRWGTWVDLAGVKSPVARLDFLILDPKIGVEILVPVDPHRKPIEAGIRSGLIIVRDPELAGAMQKQSPFGALNTHRPLALRPPDPSPVIGALQQRFDFPRKKTEIGGPLIELTPSSPASDEFVNGVRIPRGAHVLYQRGLIPTLILVDPAVGASPGCQPPVGVEGRWAAATGAGDKLLRLEIDAAGSTIGRWLLINPDEQFVRAGASGAHRIVVMAEDPSKNPSVRSRQLEDGLHAWVRGVSPLRALLLT
jgi:hypothetical protein